MIAYSMLVWWKLQYLMAISDLEIRVNLVHDVIISKRLEAFCKLTCSYQHDVCPAFTAQRDILFIRWKQFVHWQNVSGTTGVVGDKQTGYTPACERET